jgi:allantoicase
VRSTWLGGAESYEDGSSRARRAGGCFAREEDVTDFQQLVDLASARLGGAAHRDERRLLRGEGKPRQGRGADLDRGQVHRPRQVDGRLGSRRRRTPGHDWAIVRLGLRA